MASGVRQFATWSKLLRRMVDEHVYNILAPPVDRSMHVLDRSFFKKVVPLAAASVFDNRDLARVRDELVKSKDVFAFPPYQATQARRDDSGQKMHASQARYQFFRPFDMDADHHQSSRGEDPSPTPLQPDYDLR